VVGFFLLRKSTVERRAEGETRTMSSVVKKRRKKMRKKKHKKQLKKNRHKNKK
jgi:hypothetical protein